MGAWCCRPVVLQASRGRISFEQGKDFAGNNSTYCIQVSEVTDRNVRLFPQGVGRAQVLAHQLGSRLEATGNSTAV